MDGGRRLGQVAAAAARRPVGAQGDRADGRGLRTLADGVGHAQPAPVGRCAVIDPVAADVIGGQDRARHLGTHEARDPRRHEVLLELGGGAARAVAPRPGQHVRVALGQLEGRRPAPRQRLDVAGRRRREDEHAQRTAAQRQRHHRGSVRQPTHHRGGLRRRDLGPDQLRRLQHVRQSAVAGHPAQRAPVEVGDVERGGHAGRRASLGHEPLGHSRELPLFQQVERIRRHGAPNRPPARPCARSRGGSAPRARPRRPAPRGPWADRDARAGGRARPAGRPSARARARSRR